MPSRPTPSVLDVEREYQIDSPEEREQRFRQVFDDGPVGIVLVGTDFRFLAMNRAFCDMLGYDVSELLNRTIPDVTHPHDVDDNREAVRQLFAGETPAVRVEKRYLTKSGDVLHAQVSAWPIRNASGLVTHGVAAILDITAQKTARGPSGPSAGRARRARYVAPRDSSPSEEQLTGCLQLVDAPTRPPLDLFRNPGTHFVISFPLPEVSTAL